MGFLKMIFGWRVWSYSHRLGVKFQSASEPVHLNVTSNSLFLYPLPFGRTGWLEGARVGYFPSSTYKSHSRLELGVFPYVEGQ